MMNLRAISKTLDPARDTWMFSMIIGTCALLCLYGYFIFGAISNGGQIENVQRLISENSSRLGDLEASYMTLKRTISIHEAYALGFEDADPAYISRTANTAVALSR